MLWEKKPIEIMLSEKKCRNYFPSPVLTNTDYLPAYGN